MIKSNQLVITICLLSSLFSLSIEAQTTIELNHDYKGPFFNQDLGGQIKINDELGNTLFGAQGDFHETAMFMFLSGGNNGTNLIFDGNYNGGGDPLLSISGSSDVIFDTNSIGDNSVILPNSSISNLEREDEAGLASNTNEATVEFVNSYSTLTSHLVFCPTPGYLITFGTIQLNLNKVLGQSLTTTVGLTQDPNLLNGAQDISIGLPASAATGNYFHGVSVHGVFQVDAGFNTIYLIGREAGGDGASSNDANISLMFVPTLYGSFNNFSPEEDPELLSLEDQKGEEIDQEFIKTQSILAHQKRMDAEMESLKSQVEKIKANLGNQ